VGADHYQGVFLALEQFAKLGYIKVAALIGDIQTSVSSQRYEGYKFGVERFGLSKEKGLVKLGKSSEEDGYRLTKQLLQMKDRPKALLICHNELTKGCIRAIHEQGIKSPSELALIGIDDVSNGAIIQPRMTYVSQPLKEMSQKVYDLLMTNLDNPGMAATKVLFPVQLVVRDSCGAQK
jgi:DNA-binding LacI/PurR family transcriptional regulator